MARMTYIYKGLKHPPRLPALPVIPAGLSRLNGAILFCAIASRVLPAIINASNSNLVFFVVEGCYGPSLLSKINEIDQKRTKSGT